MGDGIAVRGKQNERQTKQTDVVRIGQKLDVTLLGTRSLALDISMPLSES